MSSATATRMMRGRYLRNRACRGEVRWACGVRGRVGCSKGGSQAQRRQRQQLQRQSRAGQAQQEAAALHGRRRRAGAPGGTGPLP